MNLKVTYSMDVNLSHTIVAKDIIRCLPFSTYTPRGGGGQSSDIVPLCITCKKGGGGPDSM